MTRVYVRAVCLLLAVLAFTGCESEGDNARSARIGAPASPGLLVVSYGEDSADTIVAPGTDSIVVLDWLRYGCDSLQRPLETQEFAFGDLVIGIGAKRNGEDGYWLYKVNGEPVPKGASAHQVSSRDTVLFFFK